MKDREFLEQLKKKVILRVQEIFDKIPPNFPAKTLQARSQWDDIFKALKERNCQLLIRCLSNNPHKGEIKLNNKIKHILMKEKWRHSQINKGKGI